MLKIGRYGVALGPVLWFQTKAPTRIRHFLCFWFLKEVRATDVDTSKWTRKQQFPLGTPLEQEGRRYYYYKAGEDVSKGAV